MENMPERMDSKFRFVLVSATRAEQLMQGARPKIDPTGQKVTRVAMEEVTGDLVPWSLVAAADLEEPEAAAPAEDEAPAEDPS